MFRLLVAQPDGRWLQYGNKTYDYDSLIEKAVTDMDHLEWMIVNEIRYHSGPEEMTLKGGDHGII